ncbi:MAG: DEAD/DEAH box helicase [Verrucomicrobia bacterium]|nr:DEAD/DEAH box helicase [Verrucomicrobiota bacterium]
MKALFQLPFDRLTAARGHHLHQAGGVRGIFGDAQRIEAHVVEDERPQTVHFERGEGEAWVARCTCPIGAEGTCVHAHAATRAVLEKLRRREPIAPLPSSVGSPPPDPALSAEAAYRGALERAFHEYRRRRAITHEVLAYLAPDWPESAAREWRPWSEIDAPQTAGELWQYLALALHEAGYPLPEFMLPETRLAETAARAQQTAASEEMRRWEEAIATFNASTPLGRPEHVAIRLNVGFELATLEWRRAGATGEEAYRTLEREELQRLMALGRQSLLVIEPAQATALWLAFLNHWHSFQTLEFECNVVRTRRILNGLFSQPDLTQFLVSREGLPFHYGGKLAWECRHDADGSRYLIQLATPDGVAPAHLMHLPGARPLYLAQDTLFDGPPSGNFTPGDHYTHVLPAPVVESRAGVELLHRLGVPAPAHLQSRVRTVPMKVELLCELETKGFKHPHEELSVLARAVGDGRVEVLQRDQWVVETEPPTVAGEPLALYDRTSLAQVPALLEQGGLKPGRFDARWRRRVDGDFALEFSRWLTALPPDVAPLIHDSQLATLQLGPLRPKLSFSVKSSPASNGSSAIHGPTDWFDLNLDLDVKDTELTKAELKLLLRARGNFVRLKGKGWRRLELDVDGAMQQKLAQLGIDPEDFASGPQRLHALQLSHPQLESVFGEEQMSALRERCTRLLDPAAQAPVPATITADLRPYQVDGYHFLTRLARAGLGGILADDMGLGKTVQALVWLTELQRQKAAELATLAASGQPVAHFPALVVCPKSVMENWAREAAKFAPGLRVRVLHPLPGAKMVEPDPNSADLFVVNYAQLRKRAEFYTKTNWLAVILDEGQNIKNPDSQSARTVRSLNAEHRLVLTGTPIENRLLDLWSLMAFATPGILGQRTYFEQQFEKKDDPLARVRVAARLKPFLLRRTKREVAPDLPPRIEEDRFCELEGAQAQLYRAELKKARGLLMHIESAAEFHEQRFHILQSLLRLRQICCHPALIDPALRAESSAKLDALFDLLEPLREEGHKVLVFSQFVSMLDLIRERMTEQQWPHFYLTGQTENRAAVVDAFSDAAEPATFLLSLKAAGSGLNLMAASYVVLFDPWWNPAVEAQAIDRTHRIGQANQVMAYRLLVKDSVEEKIRALQAKKAALASDVLGLSGDAGALDWKDFDFLLSE